MGPPPLSLGALHDRSIWVGPSAVAVGAPGGSVGVGSLAAELLPGWGAVPVEVGFQGRILATGSEVQKSSVPVALLSSPSALSRSAFHVL